METTQTEKEFDAEINMRVDEFHKIAESLGGVYGNADINAAAAIYIGRRIDALNETMQINHQSALENWDAKDIAKLLAALTSDKLKSADIDAITSVGKFAESKRAD